MRKTSKRILGCVASLAILLSSVALTYVGASAESAADTAADTAADAVRVAASEYVQANKNAVTPWGLEAYVREKTGDTGITLSYEGGNLDGQAPDDRNFATGAETDFFIKHSVTGMTEKLVNGSAPNGDVTMTIEGEYGGVAAIFRNVADADTVYFADGFAPDAIEEIEIDANKIAVMGVNHEEFGITVDANWNVLSVPETGVEKIVFPKTYAGQMTDQSASGTKTVNNEVKVVVINNAGINKTFLNASAFQNWVNLQAGCIGPFVDHAWFFGADQTYQASYLFAGCTSLKYFQCQSEVGGIYYGPGYYSGYTFMGCSNLQTVNMPAFSTWKRTFVGWKAFQGTKVQDFFLPEYAYDHPDMPAFNDPTFTEGIRNVVDYTTPMTFVRAAALIMADAAVKWDAGILSAATAGTLEAAVTDSTDTAAFCAALDVTWTELEDPDYMGGTLTLKNGDDEVSVSYQTSRPKGLEGLQVGYDLSPDFDPNVTEYAISVPNEVSGITADQVECTVNSEAELISKIGVSDLAVGIPQNITIVVKDNKGTEKTYTIRVTRQGNGDNSALVSKLQAAAEKVTTANDMTQDAFAAALSEAVGNDVTITVTDFYKYEAIPGAKDYSGIIVPGHDGYITAVVTATDGMAMGDVPIKVAIEAPMKEYTYTADEVSKESDFTIDEDGYLISYSGNAKKIVIPDGVVEIAFNWNESDAIEETLVMVVPDSVKYLPPNLAYGMLHLEAAYLGDGITRLEDQAFMKCVYLQYVRLPQYLETIGAQAFETAASLNHIYLPDGLKTIEIKAFRHTLLRSVTIPASVTTIGMEAFYGPFNTASHLVIGSSNENSLQTIQKDSTDEAAIQAIVDAVVDYYEDGVWVSDTRAGAPIGQEGRGLVTVTPRITTILNQQATTVIDAFGSQDIWCSGANIVRTSLDSPIYKEIADELAAAAASGKVSNSLMGVKLSVLNMNLAEVAGRAQFAADNLNLSDSTTADNVVKAIQASYVSNKVDTTLTWKEAFVLEDGKATGVLQITDGQVTFDITVDAAVGDKMQTTPDNPGNNGEPDTTLPLPPTGVVVPEHPISIQSGSNMALIDWTASELRVIKGTTIEKLLENMIIEHDYTLEFYDDNGEFIPAEYYSVAFLENNFLLRVKQGYNVSEELVIQTVEYIVSPQTGETAVAGAVLLLVFVSMVGVLALKRKTSKT